MMFAMEIHTLQTYLGIKFIERTLIACKKTLLIEHVKHLFRVIAQTPWALIRMNMVSSKKVTCKSTMKMEWCTV